MGLPSESFHGTVLGMGTCAIAVTVVASRTAMTNFMAHHSCFQFCIEIDERLLDILSRCRRFRPRWREGLWRRKLSDLECAPATRTDYAGLFLGLFGHAAAARCS